MCGGTQYCVVVEVINSGTEIGEPVEVYYLVYALSYR